MAEFDNGWDSPAWAHELLALDIGGLAAQFEHRAAQFEDLAARDAIIGCGESATYKGGVAYAYTEAASLTRALIARSERA